MPRRTLSSRTRPSRTSRRFPAAVWLIVSAALSAGGCSPGEAPIQNKGSDTMLEVAAAWSEAYHQQKGGDVEVAGGGSGVGITALIDGTVDVANASRRMKEAEKEKFRAKHPGKEPFEFVVGYDALAVYVHRNNPIEALTLAQLAEIFKEGGSIRKWSDLGIKVPGCESDSILCIRRANNSGTYVYFKEAVLGKTSDYRLDCTAATGSRDLVLRVGNTPCAIGYSGMGYKTDKVKFVKIKKTADSPAVAPSVAAALDKSYPISRPLFVYTVGEPQGRIRAYIDWIRSDAGQEVLKKIGYVPLPPDQRTK